MFYKLECPSGFSFLAFKVCQQREQKNYHPGKDKMVCTKIQPFLLQKSQSFIRSSVAESRKSSTLRKWNQKINTAQIVSEMQECVKQHNYQRRIFTSKDIFKNMSCTSPPPSTYGLFENHYVIVLLQQTPTCFSACS